ncbi:hypothetical protein TNCT_258421 [Trichonephila clavata]|uniref:Uncharacterized protein n=1 Tax=Trichonephila clavata TaxID=2740835 RepID=A0A8X6GDV4_TRICU|nr:hypothetical protein TNCT_258421 [Trichonephila clavata]
MTGLKDRMSDECTGALGMESGAIKNEDINASSSYILASVGPQNARSKIIFQSPQMTAIRSRHFTPSPRRFFSKTERFAEKACLLRSHRCSVLTAADLINTLPQ